MKIILSVIVLASLLFMSSCKDTSTFYEEFGWSLQDFPKKNMDVNSIFFLDTLNGWACGGYSQTESFWGAIYHTSDGGVNWTEQLMKDSIYLYKVYFINSQHGWTLGQNGLLYETKNGGNTWLVVKVSDKNENTLRGIYFIDEQNGWLVGTNGTLFKTTDSGVSWTVVTPIANDHFLDVKFFDLNNGILVGGESTPAGFTHGKVYKTTDGGNSWNITFSEVDTLLRKCDFTGSDVWAVGEKGKIIYSSDKGETWEDKYPNRKYTLNGVSFTTRNKGWICGYDTQIIATTDGGVNWVPQTTGQNVNLYDIIFVDDLHGWMCGQFGTILYTNNGGIDIKSK